MPQFGFYPSQIFWLFVCFGVLFFAMQFFLLPPIEKILKKREDKIKTILREADTMTSESERLEKSYQQYIDETSQEAAKILQTTHDEIAQKTAKTEEELLQILKTDTIRAKNSLEKQKSEIFGQIETISHNFLENFLSVFYKISLPKKDLKEKIAHSVRRLKHD